MNVFDRTQFDYSFDTSRFGDSLNLSSRVLAILIPYYTFYITMYLI